MITNRNYPMPVLFIGHGTPMNAIEDNEFTKVWKELGETLPRPKSILCVSAHWENKSSEVTAMETPKTIHDFGGFPRQLYEQKYPAQGDPVLAGKITRQVSGFQVREDYEWGLDHGSWSFLKHMYPDADIPVIQLSIDYTKDMRSHYELGKQLLFLRNEGVLITGSGNMIHNLWLVRPDENGFNNDFGYDWAYKLNEKMREAILAGNHDDLINYKTLTEDVLLGIPTEEHYIPLIYALALQEPDEHIKIFNDKIVTGSLSMTSLIIGNNTD